MQPAKLARPIPRGDFLLSGHWRLLNNGSFGACPQPVLETYRLWQTRFEEHPGQFMADVSRLLEEARAPLASYLGTHPGRLAFVTNATMAVNVVAHSLRSILEPGDEVLATNHEYGACIHAWQFNCARAAADYVVQPVDLPVGDAGEVVEQLWSGVTPRTRVIFISHITSPTALTFPVREICRRARDRGIITVVDGAHVPGQRELSLDELGADFYAGNCHKWMCSPKGSAFLYARPEAEMLIEPLIVGHGWQPDAVSEHPLADYVERLGTRDVAAFLSVPDAIEYMNSNAWSEVRERCHQMGRTAKQQIETEFASGSLCPDHVDWYSQMFPIHLPDDVDLVELSRRFRETHKIEIPLIRWQELAIARLSVQIYTQQDEIDSLVHALERDLPECRGGACM